MTSSAKPKRGKSGASRRAGKDKAKRRVKPHAAPAPAPAKPAREETTRIVGMIAREGASRWRIQSTNRRDRGDYMLHVKGRYENDLAEGQLAIAEKIATKKWNAREAKLIEVIGDMDAVNAVSLIAIAQNEIPTEFPKAAIAEADEAQPVTLENRTDLRSIPLVTIDGADSRDFDDAVFAEPHISEGGGEGWHLIVAIADVAHYVRRGSALDAAAYERGNSVYFPDRVVPMLPEALSNELCSLKPQVDRACMAAHLWIDKNGKMEKWQFVRGVMRSHARLTYEQVQAACDGQPDDTTRPLLAPVIKPLYGAFRVLLQARGKRGTLELDLPERKVEIGNGKVTSIKVKPRLDSHRLIEEFMILANVAAAAQLEAKSTPGLYRIHDKPTEIKLLALRDFLDSLGISLGAEKQLHPRMLTQILENSAGTPNAQIVSEIMLRSQSQAVYSPDNIGHFGLALAKYAHFTSPIRRYADLVVHRGLIRACKLGDDGLSDAEIEKLEDIAAHISATERRAANAERDATDRFITLFMADRIGATFPARISGVARFGLFARLDETGADGIIPINTLPDDYYIHDEKRQALIGRRSQKTYQLSQPVMVKLTQADRLTGSMALAIVETDAHGQPIPFATKRDGDRKSHRRRRPRS